MRKFIQKLYKDNHFKNWLKENDIDFIVECLNTLLHSTNKNDIVDCAFESVKRGIPFGEFIVFSDYVIFKLHCEIDNFISNRDIFSKAYLDTFLKNDLYFFESEMDFYKQVITKAENEVFNIHINWLMDFVKYILDNHPLPDLNPISCHIGKLFNKHRLNIPKKERIKFLKLHHQIHYLAGEALKMYNKREYFYFMTIYNELRSTSLTFREVIGNIFLYDKLVSIYIDPITRLNNRIKFLEDMQECNDYFLLLLNIKDFSKINLTYGAQFGDKTLKLVADYINKLNIVNAYRVYADEFAIITKYPQKVFNQINEKIILDDIDYIISFYGSFRKVDKHSFEICEYAMLGGKKVNLIDANNINYNNISIYRSNLSIIQKLKVALLSDKISLYTQPIFNIKKNKITKYECLMRVEDENGEVLTPYQFMDILESMAIYSEYTKSMIYKAFKQFKDNEYEFSINFSLSDIQNYHTIEFFKKMISNYPNVAKRCTIELLENEAVENFNLVNNFFKDIKKYGVKTALDDFGSGYSNFAYIFSLELNYIKIDGTIIQKILEDNKMKVLLQTLVKMAHSIDMKVIAEFVSDEEIFDELKVIDVDYAQGYFIAKPTKSL
jgi:EAL domain-containing protein (putative c-di-GMP-specific phosphodiesterase class I)/GGDEF domain-containing protein